MFGGLEPKQKLCCMVLMQKLTYEIIAKYIFEMDMDVMGLYIFY